MSWLARMVHVMADEAMRPALERLVQGFQDRGELDDREGRILPYEEFAKLYNDVEYNPENFFSFFRDTAGAAWGVDSASHEKTGEENVKNFVNHFKDNSEPQIVSDESFGPAAAAEVVADGNIRDMYSGGNYLCGSDYRTVL